MKRPPDSLRERCLDELVRVMVERLVTERPPVFGVDVLAEVLEISPRGIADLLKHAPHKLPPQIPALDRTHRWSVAQVALWLITESEVRYSADHCTPKSERTVRS